jgi:hypothetical protein
MEFAEEEKASLRGSLPEITLDARLSIIRGLNFNRVMGAVRADGIYGHGSFIGYVYTCLSSILSVFIHIYQYMYIWMYSWIYIYMKICMYLYLFTCLNTIINIYINTRINISPQINTARPTVTLLEML